MRVRYSFSSRRTGNIDNIRKQRKPYPKIAKEVVRISDIILEVLDARFLGETRNYELEGFIRREKKKLIFVLNKSDLVNVNEKKKEARAKGLVPFVLISSRDRKGAAELRKKIKIEAGKLKVSEVKKEELIEENKDNAFFNLEEELKKIDYQRKQVGVIGYPNTGKSSLINYLTGRGAAGTASEAGYTKGIQKIKLSKDILLLDTPGVIPESEYSVKKDAIAHHAKLGVRTYDKVKDPEFIVAKLLEQYLEAIETHYDVKSDGNPEKLIEEVGKKKNLLVRGGEVDVDRASRFIIKEWQAGKIKV